MKFISVYSFLARNSFLFPLAIGVLTLLMLGLTLLPTDMMGDNKIWDYDKLGHMALFGGWTLTLGLYNQIGNLPIPKLNKWIIGGLGIAFGLTVEVLQYALPLNRHADPLDFAFDVLGCLLALWILHYTPNEERLQPPK